MSSLKFLHFSPTYFSPDSVVGGGEKYIIYLCKAIEASAQAQGMPIKQTMVAFSSQPGHYELEGGLSGLVLRGEPWNPSSLNAEEIRAAMQDADVIFVHQCLHPFGLFIAAQGKLVGKTVVGMDHGGGEHRLVYQSPEIGFIFDMFLAQSTFCAASFLDLDARVEVVKGPVDDVYYCPGPSDIRQKNVLALGRVMPHKGHDSVIRALPDDMALTIIGSRYNEEYWSYLQSLIGDKQVTIVDSLSDDMVRQSLREAGIVVHASTHFDYAGRHYHKPELLGLAPLEALACGTPVLVNNAAALPELADVDGCLCYKNEAELHEMLVRFRDGKLSFPAPEGIHQSVSALYGLRSFGDKLLAALRSF